MSFFRNTASVLQREWDRIRKYPVYLTLMFILPVIAFTFFAVIFEEGVPRNMAVAVYDEDNSSLSRTLCTMIDATASADIKYKLSNMAEGEEMIRRREVLAVIHIPRNFESDIYNNTRTSVQCYITGLNITANGLLNKDIQTTVTTFATGIQLQLLLSQGLSEQEAYNQAMPVYFDSHILFNPYVNYGYYLLPSFMPMMLMLFTLLLTIFTIGTELKNRTAGEWMAAGGGRIGPALVGKMLPYTAAMFLMSLFMNTIMYKWVHVPLNGSPGILMIAAFLFILAYQSIGVLIVSVLANLRQSLSIGGGYSVLAFSFSGLTFPLIAMDPVLRVLAYIFPFTVYTDIFVDQAMRGAPVMYSIQDMGYLMIYIIVPLLCLPRLRRVASDEKFWGKL